MSVVDPLAWLPLAVIWAVTMGACWLFVSDVNRGHIEPVGWLTAMVWFMGTVVGIPVALEYVTSTPLYEWAYRTNSGVYIGSVPTPFQPMLVIFVAGILYREITWLVLWMLRRYVQPLIKYVFHAYGWRE
jgi:hypothetical protein